MISENIKNYRKEKNMSQDELAEKLGVSRQSISLWENGITQPTIENIIALAKIFNISTDTLLDNNNIDNNKPFSAYVVPSSATPAYERKKHNNEKSEKIKEGAKTVLGFLAVIAVCALVALLLIKTFSKAFDLTGDPGKNSSAKNSGGITESEASPGETKRETSDNGAASSKTQKSGDTASANTSKQSGASQTAPAQTKPAQGGTASQNGGTASAATSAPQSGNQFDLFNYCKNFAIQKGKPNGDLTMYQKPASNYGGNAGEFFSISYWDDGSNMVEFCLHCPLDSTQSINFYLRMRGGYNKRYEYLSSKYRRSDGVPFRNAKGYIDPSVFSDNYPLNCTSYEGSADGQNEFMEESRVGMCDLIHCLKRFVDVEGMECGFSAFDFVNY